MYYLRLQEENRDVERHLDMPPSWVEPLRLTQYGKCRLICNTFFVKFFEVLIFHGTFCILHRRVKHEAVVLGFGYRSSKWLSTMQRCLTEVTALGLAHIVKVWLAVKREIIPVNSFCFNKSF